MTKSPKYPIALSDSEVLVKSKPFAEFETPPGLYHWKAATRLILEPIRSLSRDSSLRVKPGALRSGTGITDAREAIRGKPH